MKEKILITGASGFIGSFLVETALQQGFEVYAGIRKTSSRAYLQQPNIHFIELNLSSKESLLHSIKNFSEQNGNFNYIIHNAGITQARKKTDFFSINFECTKNIIDVFVELNMPIKKFVLISSLAAYGPGNKNFTPININHLQNPITAYGKSKLAAEKYLQSFQNFPYIIINPTAVYGPRDKDFLQFIQLINKGIEPYIGLNKQMISLIYVKDLANVVIEACSSALIHKSYIVSDGRSYNKEELGQYIKTMLNKKTVKIKIPSFFIQAIAFTIELLYSLFRKSPFLTTEKINEISSTNWLCNSDAVWHDLAIEPTYFLATGLNETIQWYKENNWI